jgi:hypothetical protein
MRMTRTTVASESAGVDRIVSSRCPACSQETQLHSESVRRGAEILCSECCAILRVEVANPLSLSEVEEEDLR